MISEGLSPVSCVGQLIVRAEYTVYVGLHYIYSLDRSYQQMQVILVVYKLRHLS